MIEKYIEIESLDVITKNKIYKYYSKAILIPIKILQVQYNDFTKYYDINNGCRVAITKG